MSYPVNNFKISITIDNSTETRRVEKRKYNHIEEHDTTPRYKKRPRIAVTNWANPDLLKKIENLIETNGIQAGFQHATTIPYKHIYYRHILDHCIYQKKFEVLPSFNRYYEDNNIVKTLKIKELLCQCYALSGQRELLKTEVNEVLDHLEKSNFVINKSFMMSQLIYFKVIDGVKDIEELLIKIKEKQIFVGKNTYNSVIHFLANQLHSSTRLMKLAQECLKAGVARDKTPEQTPKIDGKPFEGTLAVEVAGKREEPRVWSVEKDEDTLLDEFLDSIFTKDFNLPMKY